RVPAIPVEVVLHDAQMVISETISKAGQLQAFCEISFRGLVGWTHIREEIQTEFHLSTIVMSWLNNNRRRTPCARSSFTPYADDTGGAVAGQQQPASAPHVLAFIRA